ncbi:hypothetical protein PVAND_007096 [Polypedilum vanderplanki]|uniref:Uncharacterized protein n=1 Tax=Polypedilum vanderplanki TaxID=319348 RepID=A0A9J6C659_POLVA|nr:hypothetical protein PVAND_007096 [Polypedilum vanderplanki]
MKLFIIAFAFIAVFCRTEAFEEPEEFVLLNPEFLTRSSWSHQVAYHALQDEIDSTFVEINKIVATELAKETPSAIQNYSSFSVDVLGVYNPVFERVNLLNPGSCKERVTVIIKSGVQQSGVMSDNCIVSYNGKVQEEVDAINDALKKFSGEYGQVVLNVYKAYAGRNAMVESETIEKHINNTYNDIASEWTSVGSAVGDLRASLSNNLQILGGKLHGCFGNAFTYAKAMMDLNEPQVEECENSNISSRAQSAAGASRDYIAEAKQLTENWPQFKW